MGEKDKDDVLGEDILPSRRPMKRDAADLARNPRPVQQNPGDKPDNAAEGGATGTTGTGQPTGDAGATDGIGAVGPQRPPRTAAELDEAVAGLEKAVEGLSRRKTPGLIFVGISAVAVVVVSVLVALGVTFMTLSSSEL